MLYFIASLTFCAGHRLSEFFAVVYTNVNTSLTEWECSAAVILRTALRRERMCVGGVVDVASNNDVENRISCSEPKDGE